MIKLEEFMITSAFVLKSLRCRTFAISQLSKLPLVHLGTVHLALPRIALELFKTLVVISAGVSFISKNMLILYFIMTLN